MRYFWTIVHRWAGLLMALFLIITGLTGAIISWDHELDDLLNPTLMHAKSKSGKAMRSLDLVKQIEKRYPEVHVTYLSLEAEPGESISFYVVPNINPKTGEQYKPGFNQVFLDPVTGEELGKREWGAVWPITQANFVSFLYRLHYTLHIPQLFGIDRWGYWLLGIIAIIWTLDSFVGFYLTLPRKQRHDSLIKNRLKTKSTFWQRWKPSWKIRWSAGSSKLNFDLHRAFSLWTWALLFILAFTAFSLNLYREVFYPMMSTISKVTPTPFELRKPTDKNHPIKPNVSWEKVIEVAETERHRNHWAPLGALSYSDNFGIYQARYFAAGDDHGVGGVGPLRLFIDGNDGSILGQREPWKGTAADIFVQAQFPLHSGRILGIPGRIIISFMGVIVAMLSITGIIIWWRKRKARQFKLEA